MNWVCYFKTGELESRGLKNSGGGLCVIILLNKEWVYDHWARAEKNIIY